MYDGGRFYRRAVTRPNLRGVEVDDWGRRYDVDATGSGTRIRRPERDGDDDHDDHDA